MATAAIEAMRSQIKEFVESHGINARGLVLPHGVSLHTILETGEIFGTTPLDP